MRSPLPVISIDPRKAQRIAQEVFNALGAPVNKSALDTPRVEHDLKDSFARFAPLYGIRRTLPVFRNGHWAAEYRAYLEQARLFITHFIATRNGQRFQEWEKMPPQADQPIPNRQQIPLF